MNFDKVYEKYVNGTATEEEKVYIEAEIAKARKLSAIIDEMDSKRVIEPAETEEVKKATKTMKRKLGTRVIVIALSVLLSLMLIVMGTAFTYVNIKASGKAEYTKDECVEFAKKCVNDHSNVISTNLTVTDVERDIRFYDGKLSRATYIYEIEVRKGTVEYEVEVNTATGEAVILDVDD